jgi:hypothetical protein
MTIDLAFPLPCDSTQQSSSSDIIVAAFETGNELEEGSGEFDVICCGHCEFGRSSCANPPLTLSTL